MKAAGHELCFLVNQATRGEDHSLLVPQVMGKSPDQAEVDAAFDAFAPDFVMIRNAWALSRRTARAARRRGIPAVMYDQIPASRNTSLLRRAVLSVRGMPHHRVTPVAGWPPRPDKDPFATYLPWPVAALPAPAPLAVPDGKLHLVCVAKLGLSRKNQPLLIRMIEDAGLQEQYHVTLIGSAAQLHKPGQKKHSSEIQALTSRDWITLHSRVAFMDMGNVHASAAVTILPSVDEPLGTSPIEAMAYGSVPVISSQCGSAGYLQDGQNGLVVDMTRPESVTDALRRLALDDVLRARLSAAARQTAETELSETRFTERLEALLASYGVPPGWWDRDMAGHQGMSRPA